MIIAIDGPAASGKGTLGRRLAAHYGLPHLDTGLLYRAVARALLDQGAGADDVEAAVAAAERLDVALMDDSRLRGRAMGEAASLVSAYPPVREALLGVQRRFAAQAPGAVLDGRDIGTVVCPLADVKLFVTAAAEERARRRHLEFVARDERDSSRSTAPLKVADDAVVLDTTRLDAEAAFRRAVALVEEARGRGTAAAR